MITFKKVEISDKDWIKRLLTCSDLRSADLNFSSIFVWDKTYKQMVAEVDNHLAIKLYCDKNPFYSFPIGNGDIGQVILSLKKDAEQDGNSFILRGVLAEHKVILDQVFPGCFEYHEDEALFDYIYSLDKLADLPGRKYHAKRNHIYKFTQNNDWVFEPIDSHNIAECTDIEDTWRRTIDNEKANKLLEEYEAFCRAKKFYFKLGLEGGLLRSGGNAVAYTIGERLNSDTYLIHFEKALTNIPGSYAMINREFARFIRRLHPEMRYVNRENDMNMLGLRRSKQSYYPEFLIKKHTAKYINA